MEPVPSGSFLFFSTTRLSSAMLQKEEAKERGAGCSWFENVGLFCVW